MSQWSMVVDEPQSIVVVYNYILERERGREEEMCRRQLLERKRKKEKKKKENIEKVNKQNTQDPFESTQNIVKINKYTSLKRTCE